MNSNLQLLVVAGKEAGKTFTVPAHGATLGRSRVADICLEDDALSRQHCRIYFAPQPYVEDLDSSNGTLLNGVAVKDQPAPLVTGDILAIGAWVFRVICPTEVQTPTAPSPQPPSPPAETTEEKVALFGESSTSAQEPEATPAQPILFEQEADKATEAKEGADRFKKLMFPLIALLVLLLGAVAFLMLGETEAQKPRQVRQLPANTKQVEFAYERISVDARHLFRYVLTYDVTSNVLMLDVNDLGDADRSFTKRVELPEEAKKLLTKIILEAELDEIGELFPERSADGVTFERRTLTLVRGTEVWTRVAENVTHAAFNDLCERLEFFAKNELNVWAAQYSVAELETLGAEQLEVARRYWEQRDLGDEKLWSAIVAYKQGLSALETLNPKPATVTELSAGLREAETLLATRYEEALFQVEQAMNTQRYDVAVQQLQKILRMIPDRDDARNRQASEKLLTVEQRRGKKGVR